MARSQSFPLHRFLIVWFGQLLSNIGSGVTAFALGVYVFRLTGLASSYSLVLFSAFLPSLLLKPLGGVWADRWNRKALMMIGDVGSALGVLFIIVCLSMGIKGLWVIYLGTLIASVFVAVHNPAYKASVTDLVPEAYYSRASGLLQFAESARYLVAPVVAGVLVSHMSMIDVLLIDCASFLVAVVTVFWVKAQQVDVAETLKQDSFLSDFLSGFRFTFQDKPLVLLLSIISLVTFFVGIFQALLGPMVLAFANAKQFGWLQTLSTSGMLISSVFIGACLKGEHKRRVLSAGLFFVGIFLGLMGLLKSLIWMTVLGFLFFLSLPFVNTSLDVMVRRHVPNAMQGRVWSIVSLISLSGMAIAFGVAGFLADAVFIPLLKPSGALASSFGLLMGVGPGRGIGLLFMISGLCVALTGVIVLKLGRLKRFDSVPVAADSD